MGKLTENINETNKALKEEYSVQHIDALNSCIRSVQTAIADLQDADTEKPEDFKHFIGQLKTFLSSDHGDSGLIAFRNNLLKRM